MISIKLMHWVPKLQYAFRSDVGMKRQNNEDNCAIALCPEDAMWLTRGHLFIVADGMGGHEVGELASKTAVDTIRHLYFKSSHEQARIAIKEAMDEANAAIYDIGAKNREFKRMGTTCSSLIISGEGFIIGHVGDSRIYRVRDERIDQLSFDHTVASENKLRNRRKQSAPNVDVEKFGHVLTRCLGPDPKVKVDVEGPYEYMPGDVYILCSDGVTKYLSDAEIGIIAKSLPVAEAAKFIINLANLRGGADNSTVVLVRVSDQDGNSKQPLTKEYELPPLLPKWVQPLLLSFAFLCILAAGVLSYQHWAIPAAGLGILGAIIVILAFRVGRDRERIINAEYDPDEDDTSTVFFRPYRTAAVRFTQVFMEQIQGSHHKLLDTAKKKSWEYNQQKHDAAQKKAEQAYAEKKYRVAIQEWANAIDILYGGMVR